IGSKLRRRVERVEEEEKGRKEAASWPKPEEEREGSSIFVQAFFPLPLLWEAYFIDRRR
ncbi:hypothetical protein LINPERPRIM_LOCUS33254, partial [Linum perenne]